MKDSIVIRKSRRGNRTSIRILLKGKAADGFLQALIKGQDRVEAPTKNEGGAHA
jgi:hypothetical protein